MSATPPAPRKRKKGKKTHASPYRASKIDPAGQVTRAQPMRVVDFQTCSFERVRCISTTSREEGKGEGRRREKKGERTIWVKCLFPPTQNTSVKPHRTIEEKEEKRRESRTNE